MRGKSQRGSAMVVVVVLIGSMAVLSLALLHSARSAVAERSSAERDLGAVYTAEAALSESLMDLAAGGDGTVGSEKDPVSYGKASFYVSAVDEGAGVYTLTATGTENGCSASVALTVQPSRSAFYRWAAFGDEGMTMDSNALTDSYDSSLGPYTDQDVNGSGSGVYARENGHVGSNTDITIASNSTVHGSAIPGPTGVASITDKAVVTGTTVPSTSTVPLEPFTAPVIPSAGDLTVTGDPTWPAGDYAFDQLFIDNDETLTIEGPARLLVDDFWLESNSSLVIDDSAGPIEIYVLDDFIMDSNTLIGAKSFDPASVSLFLESDNVLDPSTNVQLATVEFNSNAQLYGSIYAPNARIKIDSNFELFGSVIARSVHLDSNSRVHFDEKLLTTSLEETGGYETLCWRFVSTP